VALGSLGEKVSSGSSSKVNGDSLDAIALLITASFQNRDDGELDDSKR
jgi:hypothetical protein